MLLCPNTQTFRDWPLSKLYCLCKSISYLTENLLCTQYNDRSDNIIYGDIGHFVWELDATHQYSACVWQSEELFDVSSGGECSRC
jgi:hypothetical protein